MGENLDERAKDKITDHFPEKEKPVVIDEGIVLLPTVIAEVEAIPTESHPDEGKPTVEDQVVIGPKEVVAPIILPESVEEEEIVETKKKLSRADLKSSVKVDFGKLLPTTSDKPTRRKRKEKVEEESPIFPDVTEKQETPEESESERNDRNKISD